MREGSAAVEAEVEECDTVTVRFSTFFPLTPPSGVSASTDCSSTAIGDLVETITDDSMRRAC